MNGQSTALTAGFAKKATSRATARMLRNAMPRDFGVLICVPRQMWPMPTRPALRIMAHTNKRVAAAMCPAYGRVLCVDAVAARMEGDSWKTFSALVTCWRGGSHPTHSMFPWPILFPSSVMSAPPSDCMPEGERKDCTGAMAESKNVRSGSDIFTHVNQEIPEGSS